MFFLSSVSYIRLQAYLTFGTFLAAQLCVQLFQFARLYIIEVFRTREQALLYLSAVCKERVLHHASQFRPRSLLPPCVQSSVLACWLGFGQAGLSSLPTSAFVAHLQPNYNPKVEYRIKSQKLQIHKICNIKDLKNLQKMMNVLNILLPL